MRIAVLGAAGAMAQVVLRDLLEFVPDVAITAADLRPVRRTPDPRVRAGRRSTRATRRRPRACSRGTTRS